MGIARFLIILVVHVTDIRCQFLFIDGNGKGNIPAKTQNGNDIGDTLDRRTGTADEEQGIVDTLPVKMSIDFAERQCFIDIIGCKMDRLFLQVSFTLRSRYSRTSSSVISVTGFPSRVTMAAALLWAAKSCPKRQCRRQ